MNWKSYWYDRFGWMSRIRNALLTTGCVFALVGCGNGSAIPTSSVASTVGALQASGALPKLDVSPSLTGTDLDGNGVRDDLDAYIAALKDSPVQQKALTQLAQAIQATLSVDLTKSTALTAASLNINRGVTCVWQSYGANQHAKVQLIQELSINTLIRLQAYEKYNAARNGSVLPSLTGSTCN